MTYSEETKYPADILGINLKYIDNPQAHDARSETLTWVWLAKREFPNKRSKLISKTVLVTYPEPECQL